MGKVQRTEENDTNLILDTLRNADMWAVFTAEADGEKAHIAVRESSEDVLISIIAMMLDNEEIYKKVQKKIAMMRAEDEKNGKKPTNPNVN